MVVEPTNAAPTFNTPFDPDGWNSMRVEVRNPGMAGPYDTSGNVSAAVYTQLRM